MNPTKTVTFNTNTTARVQQFPLPADIILKTVTLGTGTIPPFAWFHNPHIPDPPVAYRTLTNPSRIEIRTHSLPITSEKLTVSYILKTDLPTNMSLLGKPRGFKVTVE